MGCVSELGMVGGRGVSEGYLEPRVVVLIVALLGLVVLLLGLVVLLLWLRLCQ